MGRYGATGRFFRIFGQLEIAGDAFIAIIHANGSRFDTYPEAKLLNSLTVPSGMTAWLLLRHCDLKKTSVIRHGHVAQAPKFKLMHYLNL